MEKHPEDEVACPSQKENNSRNGVVCIEAKCSPSCDLKPRNCGHADGVTSILVTERHFFCLFCISLLVNLQGRTQEYLLAREILLCEQRRTYHKRVTKTNYIFEYPWNLV